MAAAGPPSSSSHHSEPRASIRSQSSAGGSNSTLRHAPRSLPPWIDSYEVRYGTPTEDQLRAINSPPPRTLPAQHNHSPSQVNRRVSKDGFVYDGQAVLGLDTKRRSRARLRKLVMRKDAAERGRKWDHLRSAEPVIVPRYSRANPDTPWRSYLQSSRYGRLPNEEAEIVDPEVLEKLQPGFSNAVGTPRLPDTTGRGPTRTRRLYKRLWRLILRHPLVPLVFRLTVLLTSIVALALSARIFQLEEHGGVDRQSSERTQALVAIVVDTIAVPYIGYMTWDEYTGRPLGLRSATAKISLVLMDLFFIIFKSASTALAFEALVYHNSLDLQTSQYSQALAAFQTVSLIAWSFTFTVNVFRLVQKLGGREGGGEDDR
ncbi:Regulator of phospholipase D SRF1 [Madurella fahalii]|uniref:Regulator of phospholipase D SRF1 n=1 Tax=Madurella fahalii TaxID=1157608 RepID=A0ABQ0GG45_9PEZI